jgi:DNA-binding transcriptional MerR regulator
VPKPIERTTTGTERDERPDPEPDTGRRRGARAPRGRVAPLPTAPDPHRYTIGDLEAETGFNQRTIRYYITQGLLAPAHGRGPSATYDLGHLLRLRMIALLKAAHRPLDEIRARLADLSDREIAAMLEIETAPPEDRWRRVQLHPDIELHVRERGTGRDGALADAVDLIVGLARPVIDRLEDTR